MKSREINQNMRSIMNTKVGIKATAVFLIYLAITGIISFIGDYLPLSQDAIVMFQNLMSIFVLSALGVGYQKYNLDLYRGKGANGNTLFEVFSRRYYFKIVLMMLLMMLYVMAIAFIVFVPYGILLVFIATLNLSDFVFVALVTMLMIITIVAMLFFLARISQANYRILDNPTAGSFHAVSSSFKMMKGRVWSYFKQNISLLPLHLLPLIVALAVLLIDIAIRKDFPFIITRDNLAEAILNNASQFTAYFDSKLVLLYLASIIPSLFATPRISMSLAIWYDDKAKEANLPIE